MIFEMEAETACEMVFEKNGMTENFHYIYHFTNGQSYKGL
jgi:hypothetical protein